MIPNHSKITKHSIANVIQEQMPCDKFEGTFSVYVFRSATSN